MKRICSVLILLFITSLVPSHCVQAQTTPTNTDAKRAWGIAQIYIEEESPELAIAELKKVIDHENFAPAYIKLIELCYNLGDVNHVDLAEKYAKGFISLWPAREDEIKDIVALGEARGKLRKKKFYESLIGDWHTSNLKVGEWFACFRIRKNENGNIYAIVPQEMWDFDYVTEWQDGKFMQWEGDNGVYIYEAGYGKTYDGYRVKINTAEGNTYWHYVYLYIPFEQPYLSDGKIKATLSTRTSGPNNANFSNDYGEITLIKN